MDWLFDGLGTEIIIIIITLIIGVLGGGIIGYKIGIKKTKIYQTQEAEDKAKQNQKLDLFIDDTNSSASNKIENTKLSQKQIAKDNASQAQVGEIHHE